MMGEAQQTITTNPGGQRGQTFLHPEGAVESHQCLSTHHKEQQSLTGQR